MFDQLIKPAETIRAWEIIVSFIVALSLVGTCISTNYGDDDQMFMNPSTTFGYLIFYAVATFVVFSVVSAFIQLLVFIRCLFYFTARLCCNCNQTIIDYPTTTDCSNSEEEEETPVLISELDAFEEK